MNNLERCKSTFLEKYNQEYSVQKAISRAIAAAVQHNLLYSKSASIKERSVVKSYWGNRLNEIGNIFKSGVDIKQYEQILIELKKEMNNKFENFLDNKSPHGSMFRISHSQKSISVFVKHLWCMNVVPEPSICPVDRIILSSTAAKYDDLSWGYVNTIEDHRRKFKYIQDAAALENKSVAQWELLKFST